jgi:hypothetical protein
VLLLLAASASVQAAEQVVDYTCPGNEKPLDPGADLVLAANHEDGTTYRLSSGTYFITTSTPISNTLPLCYIGSGGTIIKVTASNPSLLFFPSAPLAFKDLTIDGQSKPGITGINVLTGDLYAEHVNIQNFGGQPLNMGVKTVSLREVKFKANNVLTSSTYGVVRCSGATLIMDTVSGSPLM